MDNNNENGGFRYTYSASEQAEIKRIRDKYSNSPESKIERLRRLDALVTEKAQTVSLIIGVVGALLLGLGMSFIMSDLAEMIGLSVGVALPLGIVIGVIGAALTSVAYPVYNAIVKKERARIAPEILSLTEELMR